MSLQLIAKQMEAKGRKGDSMLVHMTAGEVAGLQKLAEAAGGSLSVNPETGLVEANFLKRMLPTLVGLGVGAATMNPFAGAAAGAAVGGYQARRNDQDVLLGAAMGGLGGYGGASLGAGLGAAGAPTVAGVAAPTAATVPSSVGTSIMNPATMGTTVGPGITLQGVAPAATTGVSAAPLTAAQGLSQAGQGISALGTEAGRGAFMSKVGGGAGLISDVGMAATPLMAPGKMEAPEEIPVDDEMYYTEYNPGQTGQRSSTSSEARQFSGGYAPMEKIKAADYMERRNRRYAAEGGLMSLAEGGDVTDAADAGIAGGMSGASKAAFDYLMGRSATSSGQQAAAPAQATMTAPAQASARSDREYIFNPATGAFSRNPNFVVAAAPVKSVGRFANFGRLGSDSDGSGRGDYADPNPGWTDMSDADKAAYYRENPTMAAITQAGQKAASFTKLGIAQQYAVPDFVERQRAIAQGIDISPTTLGSQQVGENVVGYDYSQPVGADKNRDYSGWSAADLGEAAGGLITLADGGLMGLAKGGMKSGGFVVPADVVSMIGEGNTDAGYSRIKSMIPGATAIKGKDGGQADTVKTHIEGKQPARVAHGEMYIPPETVKRMGGAKKLYAMMDRVREQATGSKKQIKPVSLKRAMA